MGLESEFVGHWMASTYLPDGIRIDYALALEPDHGFVWRSRRQSHPEHCSQGVWRHDPKRQLLYFTPSDSGPVYGPDNPQLWRVVQIEPSTFMLLQWVALASRNLPVLFYRVHLKTVAQVADDNGAN